MGSTLQYILMCNGCTHEFCASNTLLNVTNIRESEYSPLGYMTKTTLSSLNRMPCQLKASTTLGQRW
jgi:hypothetical protein